MKWVDLFKRGWLYQATGYTILVSFIFTNVCLVFVPIPHENRELFIHIVGIIDAAFIGNLVNFFYGSSSNKKQILPIEKENTKDI